MAEYLFSKLKLLSPNFIQIRIIHKITSFLAFSRQRPNNSSLFELSTTKTFDPPFSKPSLESFPDENQSFQVAKSS